MTKRLKYFHLDTCGIFPDILENAWDKERENETLDRIRGFLHKVCNIAHPSAIARFMVIHSGKPVHAHLNYKTPWLWEDNKINFRRWQKRYWQLDNKYLKLLEEFNIDDLPIAFMREYYSSFLKRNQNKQGIDGLLDPGFLRYAKQYTTRLIKRQLQKNMHPNIIFVNEIAHGGSDERYHQIANWHRDLWLHLEKKELITLSGIWADTSLSEATRAQLVYHNKKHAYCPKCGKYEWDNIKRYRRRCSSVKHTIGIKGDLEQKSISFKAWLGSANGKGKGSEDGSKNPEAEIIPVTGLKYRIGTPEQLGNMLGYIWGSCKEARRIKRYFWGMFHMGQFSYKNGVIKSYFHDGLPAVYWERLDAVGQKHREIWG